MGEAIEKYFNLSYIKLNGTRQRKTSYVEYDFDYEFSLSINSKNRFQISSQKEPLATPNLTHRYVTSSNLTGQNATTSHYLGVHKNLRKGCSEQNYYKH